MWLKVLLEAYVHGSFRLACKKRRPFVDKERAAEALPAGHNDTSEYLNLPALSKFGHALVFDERFCEEDIYSLMGISCIPPVQKVQFDGKMYGVRNLMIYCNGQLKVEAKKLILVPIWLFV